MATDSTDAAAEKLRALILDGQDPYHDWQVTTPVMKKILEESGQFVVEVATSPPKGSDMSKFRPSFANYDVVVSSYNGDPWPIETQQAFEEYVRDGGGFVCLHAANNAFPDWREYNEICGVGGWRERNEKHGPFLYFQDDKLVRDMSPGPGGHHGERHEFLMHTRDSQHPITFGLPAEWMHAKDELYDTLRGPAKNLTVLASAYSDPATGGTGRHEPLIMVLKYGKGRVYHTAIGHADYSMQCVGFITTFVRGTEWAATGSVTTPVPDDFPTADQVRTRE